MNNQAKAQLFNGADYRDQTEVIEKNNLPVECVVTDTTEVALKELYEIEHPERKDHFEEEQFKAFLAEKCIDQETYGNWAYYPWRNQLVKLPIKNHLQMLRTARNQLLITPQEQQELLEKTILIAGMSVGSNVVEQLIHGGIGGKLLIADMDTLEITNLNRIKTGVVSVGLPKVIDVARKVAELDPYLEVVVLDKGVNKSILDEIITEHDVDIFIDEVDDIAAKIALRQAAKQTSKPLIMATDNSDGALIDIERYDTDESQIFFNNRIPQEILSKMTSGELSREESGQAIGAHFVGIDIVDNRLIESLMQVRRTIPSWPQLGTAAGMSGILAAYCAKIILLGGSFTSDRYVADFDKNMNVEFGSEEYKLQREELLRKLTN